MMGNKVERFIHYGAVNGCRPNTVNGREIVITSTI
jgi:hypothetical protein